GAAATRLTLVARGLPRDHPTRAALETVESAAMLAELAISRLGERQLGTAGDSLRSGRPRLLFGAAKSLVGLGLSLRLVRRADNLASVSYLAAGVLYRYAWVSAGKASARDDAAVVDFGRDRARFSHEPSVARE